MIQLANDPNASRTSSRPGQNDGRNSNSSSRQPGRSGHSWPFLSRYAARPAQQDNQKPTARDSGS